MGYGTVTFILFVALVLCCSSYRVKSKPRCEEKRQDVCRNYDHTSFPNLLGHTTQEEAFKHFEAQLYPLILLGCHQDVEQFLCLIYFPKCSPNTPAQAFLPCQKMCYSVQERCEPLLQSYGQFTWNFPCHTYPKDANCVMTRRDLQYDLTMPPVTDAPGQIKCASDQFKCTDNLRCIPQTQRCDGLIDCQNMSDETNCGYCSSNAFQCDNGKCISHLQMCDRFDNCGDNSDEKECTRDSIIQKLLNDMLTCDCSNSQASVPSYTDICMTETIIKARVANVRESNGKYKYRLRIEIVLKGDQVIKRKKASFEMQKVDSCDCTKERYEKGAMLYISGRVRLVRTKRDKIKNIHISSETVDSFVIPENAVDHKSLKFQVKDCQRFSKNYSRSTSKVRIG